MRSVYGAFASAYKSGAPNLVRVTLTDDASGESVVLDESVTSGVSVSKGIGDGSYSVGNFVCGTASFTFLSSAADGISVKDCDILVEMGYELTSTERQYVPLGKFATNEDNVNDAGQWTTVTAFELPYWAVVPCDIEWARGDDGKVSIRSAMSQVCTKFGIEYVASTIPDVSLGTIAPEGSVRDAIAFFAGLCCCNAVCDGDGKVRFVHPGASVKTIAAEERFASGWSISPSSPQVIGRVETTLNVYSVPSDEEPEVESSQLVVSEPQGAAGSAIIYDPSVFAGGEFAEGSAALDLAKADVRAIADAAVAGGMLPVSVKGFSAEMLGGCELELADAITVTDSFVYGEERTYSLIVTGITYSYSGMITVGLSATSSSEDSASPSAGKTNAGMAKRLQAISEQVLGLASLATGTSRKLNNYLRYDEDSGLVVGNLDVDVLKGNTQITSEGVNVRNGETVLAHFGEETVIGSKADDGVAVGSDGVSIFKDGSKVARFGQRYVNRGMMQELVSVGSIESASGGGVYTPEIWMDYGQVGFSNDGIDELNLAVFGEANFCGNVKLVPDPAFEPEYEGFRNVIKTVSITIASSSISGGSSNTKNTGTLLKDYVGYKVIGTPRHRFPDQVAWLDRGCSVNYDNGYPVITFYIRNMGSSASSSSVTCVVDLIK